MLARCGREELQPSEEDRVVTSDESVQVIAEPQAEIYLGDVAELTEGIGRSSSEAKRQPYN